MWILSVGDPYITLRAMLSINNGNSSPTAYISQNHTALNIKEVLLETLQQWKLDPGKLVGITTDSGSNVKLACELLRWIRLSCFGHNLNLAVLSDSRIQHALKAASQGARRSKGI